MAIDVGKYKQDVISKIINDAEIVSVIDSGLATSDQLLKTHIFPYMRVPNVEKDSKTYILMSVSVKTYSPNDSFGKVRLTLRVLTSQDHMETSYGETRNDYLAKLLIKLFDGIHEFGCKELRCVSNDEYVLGYTHHFRDIVFETFDIND